MENETIYALRQAILIAVGDAYGPVTFERARQHVELYGIDSAMILDQWRLLCRNGYLEEVAGSDGKYVRISGKGTEQLTFRRSVADAFIHGAKAL